MPLVVEPPRTVNEGLAEAPRFTPHRRGITAVDALPVVNVPPISHGLDSKGWEEVVANVKLGAGVTSVTVEVNFWSDLDSKFVPANPAVTFTLTASGSIRFASDGRRFYLRASALVGAGTVDIDVAGASPHPEEWA